MTAPTDLQTPAPKEASPSRLWAFLRDYWLLIAGLAAVAALILGFIGFSLQETSWSVGNRLYAAAELFKLYTDSKSPPNNIYLEIAQWLAPAAVGYAAFQTLAHFFGQQRTILGLRFMHDHVVICGLGRCGVRLARSFRQSPDHYAVVVIDRNPTTADKRECRDLGVPVLIGDARDVAVLEQAGLERAHYLIAVCGNDAVDSEVASAAVSMLSSHRNLRSLRCLIHIGDHKLAKLLEKLALLVPDEKMAQLSQFEWFNVYSLGPTALLNSDADLLKSQDSGSPHVIVIGAGLLGRNLVIEAARRWSVGQHPRPIRITLVASDAEDKRQRLTAEFPHLPYVCDLVAVSIDAAKVSSAGELKIDLPSGHSRTRAFVCVADDDECLRATIQIRETLPEDVEVVTCTTGSSGIAAFLRNKTGILSRVTEFALLDIALTPEVLLDTAKEQVAQALHADYLENRRLHPQLEDARVKALTRWGELPESFKQANRAKAASIGDHLAKFGFKIVRNDAWRAPTFVFDQTQVGELAKSEHERWARQKRAEGWQFSLQRNDDKKLNPFLVDWTELPQAIREIDYSFATRLPTILASVGYGIVRKDGSPSRHGS